ncbi:nucleotidyltransferase domain-containing protein, partial [Roseivivax sp. CAU 1753]
LSRTRRTARSRTSGEYLFVVLLMMLHPTQELEPPANPARFKDLDLTETQFDRARQSYGAVGDWLSGSTDPLLVSVLVYLQESSALGTAVKPIGRREFDVDLICFCAGIASGISPTTLKAAVGNRLKEHATYVRLLEEKKRCWCLNYAEDFHLDLSPTIANPVCGNQGELVPDRALKEWHPTNPRAYKTLFDERAALWPTFVGKFIAMQRDEATVEPFPVQEAVKASCAASCNCQTAPRRFLSEQHARRGPDFRYHYHPCDAVLCLLRAQPRLP